MTEKQYEELAKAIANVKALMKHTDVVSVDISNNSINDVARVLVWHDSEEKADWEIRSFDGNNNQKVKTIDGVEFFVIVDK